MKLRSQEDKMLFLADAGHLDLLESFDIQEEVSEAVFEDFMKRRKPLTTGLVSFRKSQITKQGWRSSRWKHLKGIHKFHRSIEGKRAHRALGRFLSTRITRDHHTSSMLSKDRSESLLEMAKFETLKALSSYRTHFFIEGEYYKPLQEDVEFFFLLEYALPLLSSVELKIYTDILTPLTEDETELLLRLCDEKELCKSFPELFETLSTDEVCDTYKAIQGRMLSEGSSTDETSFYSRLIDNFLPCLFDTNNSKQSISYAISDE